MFIPCSLMGLIIPRIIWKLFPLSQDVAVGKRSKEALSDEARFWGAFGFYAIFTLAYLVAGLRGGFVTFGGLLAQFLIEKMGMMGSLPLPYGHYVPDVIVVALIGIVTGCINCSSYCISVCLLWLYHLSSFLTPCLQLGGLFFSILSELQLYHYGETVSIPFFTEIWRTDSFYEKIQQNRNMGLHTLCMLGLFSKQPYSKADINYGLLRGRKTYEPPRYMTINTAIEQLLEIGQAHEEPAYSEDTECVGFARLGSEDQMIVAGTMKQLQLIDFEAPLHCLVITGKTHPLEEEMQDFYRCRS